MTFPIIARCAESGKVGACIATGSPSVGGRGVIFAKSGLGALSPAGVIERACAVDPDHEWRQIGVVDARGRTAARTGSKARPWAGHFVGEQFVVFATVSPMNRS